MATLNLNLNKLKSSCKVSKLCCVSYTPNDPDCTNYGHGCECRGLGPDGRHTVNSGVGPPSKAQSLDAKTIVSEVPTENQTNVEFSDQTVQYQLAIGRNLQDMTFGVHKNGSDDLYTFMQRPIRIYTKTWAVNESPIPFDLINPWELFLADTKVINKIQTFKLLHGTLRLKFMLNGSPFHYGRMFVGVRPTKFDNNTSNLDPAATAIAFTYNDENNTGDKVINVAQTLYSQRPHVFLDPSTNQPQEITWPFFAQYNWIDLADPTTVDRLGRLEIWQMTPLRHSNGSTDSVTISCFAWMEDVVFAGLTLAEPSVAQSYSAPKKSKTKSKPTFTSTANASEYKEGGVISGPASTVAKYAGYFTEIPYIGIYAKATEMAANAVGGIARLFGFSRPAVLTDTVFVRPQTIGNLANTSGQDPLMRLTLDPKQELTVDPRTVGLTNEDQMSFAYVAKREAWIDTFEWRNTGEQNTGLLYSIHVHPMIAPVIQAGTLEELVYFQTPISFVARPFEFWTGAIRFRFQIVASQMHRGRLLFVYEPTAPETGAVTDTNSRYAHIVDISQDRDVSFEVNWTQSEAYRELNIDEQTNQWAVTGPVGLMDNALLNNMSNGRINVYVLNELACPSGNCTLNINVFISAGDTFEVKKPDRRFGTRWAYANALAPVGPPSTSQSYSAGGAGSSSVTKDENKPEQDDIHILNGTETHYCPEQSSVYYGENILSFRALLKRYCFHRLINGLNRAVGSPFFAHQYWHLKTVPIGPGPTYGSSNGSALTPAFVGENQVNYGICTLTYIRYCMQAYIGYRGSIRYKYAWRASSASHGSYIVANRADDEALNEATGNEVIAMNALSNSAAGQAMLLTETRPYSTGGLAVSASIVNPTLEVEFPFYYEFRYAENFEPLTDNGSAPDYFYQGVKRQNHYVGLDLNLNSTTIDNFNQIDSYVAAGEDYSLFFFIGAPPITANDAADVALVGPG